MKFRKLVGVIICSASIMLMSCGTNKEETMDSTVITSTESLESSSESNADEMVSTDENQSRQDISTTATAEVSYSEESERTEVTEEYTTVDTTAEEDTTETNKIEEETIKEEINQDIIPIYKRHVNQIKVYGERTETTKDEQTVDSLGHVHYSHYTTETQYSSEAYTNEGYLLYEYDNKGNLVEYAFYEDEELMQHGVNYAATRFIYEYDDKGYKIKYTDVARGEIIIYKNDEYGNVESSISNQGYQTYYINTVDEKGRLIRQKEGTTVSEYEYDEKGNLLKEIKSVSGSDSNWVFSYTYNENGLILSSVRDYGYKVITTTYTYDDQGRIVLKVEESSGNIDTLMDPVNVRTEYTYEDIS